MGALAATLLPAAVGLALVGLARPLERRWGVASANAAAARAALLAAVLACLVLWQAIQRDQLEHRLAWIRVGRTTTIDWIVQLDGLGLALAVVALAALVLGVVASLAFGTAGGGRPGARLALAAGGALVVASGGTLVQLAIGVGLVVLALRAWPSDHVSSDMPDRTWLLSLVGAGLALAIVAWLAAAGDFDLMRLERASFAQERSELVRGRIGGPLFGLPPGAVATLAAGAAALAWAVAWPRLLARAWAEGPAPALVATCVAAPALGVVLLRTQVALATAPTALALLTAAAAGTAAWAGIEAARARTSARALTCGTVATLAIATATIAIGEPIAAAQLLVAGGLAWAAPIAGLFAPRRLRAGIAAVAALGLAVALGPAVAALWNDLSAWSSGLNALAPALALVGVAGAASGVRRVLTDRTDAPGWPRPEAPPLLLGVGAVLALAAVAAALWPLAPRIWPLFVAGRMFEGAYALGPRPGAWIVGPWVGAGLVAAGIAVGLALAPRIQPAPARTRPRPAGAAGPTIPRLLRLGERLVGRLTLWPGDERVTVAPGRFDVRGPLLLAIAGTLAILGSVFCNPDVVVLGPTRVHPVDLGGLDAAMAGARRGGGQAAPQTSVRGPGPGLEGQGEDIGPAPRGLDPAGAGDMPEGAGAGAGDMPEGAGAGAAAEHLGAGAGDMLEGASAAGAARAGESRAGSPGAGAGDMLEGAGAARAGESRAEKSGAGAGDMPEGAGSGSAAPTAGESDGAGSGRVGGAPVRSTGAGRAGMSEGAGSARAGEPPGPGAGDMSEGAGLERPGQGGATAGAAGPAGGRP
ncbi:NADH:ubiquinone oxidoreductase subunit 5 (chain L)/Multisubunit Na+/H+ antiporter, MnhA subunit [Nannocystis exedens]|uniref:NADH:ubiquinone oxidoreductase subunit 5 (Chain L)/Multisubunit Na+/H+ antiporter, MnhA subunit n=1 Tax=Nannocystis exedens TaxID=54 RepID=A0A1I1TMJ9_9BACT|nr:hypothetical protein [Nannocystis exedens]PCC66577.1 hypothetical protein NAEX_09166 [Nannocystis exedens]SFD57693.1 NADH:ubiquinone oxidoreductase subunit 5 (chain L)/Multisubunit Na+/H+ antiporter, MnhA subunit [Nannocystis exedens]